MQGTNAKIPPSVELNTEAHNVHTSAQLRKPLVDGASSASQKTFQKRSTRKAITDSVVLRLVDLDSPMKGAYWRTWHCSRILLQDGQRVTSRYCNARWCGVCNAIRTSKLMEGYAPAIEGMADPYFVTLSDVNSKASNLRSDIDGMRHSFRRISDKLRKQSIPLKGIRKLECTINDTTREYHPHYHLILDGKEAAHAVYHAWLNERSSASWKGQDITRADPNTSMELFKYFSKILTPKGNFMPRELDIMFQAIKGKRVFQPFGGIRKVCEDINDMEARIIDWRPSEVEIWEYQAASEYSDWYNALGEQFTEGELSSKTMRLIQKIEHGA